MNWLHLILTEIKFWFQLCIFVIANCLICFTDLNTDIAIKLQSNRVAVRHAYHAINSLGIFCDASRGILTILLLF